MEDVGGPRRPHRPNRPAPSRKRLRAAGAIPSRQSGTTGAERWSVVGRRSFRTAAAMFGPHERLGKKEAQSGPIGVAGICLKRREDHVMDDHIGLAGTLADR